MKKTKKIMSLALALVMALTVIVGSVSVFAANNIESGYKENGWVIDGWINLSNVVNNVVSNKEITENDKTYYKGSISAEFNQRDLFEGAYQKYKKDFENEKRFGKYCRNIIMFNKGGTKPTVECKVKFPKGVAVDVDAIEKEFTKNNVVTDLVKSIEFAYDESDNSVNITFYLATDAYWHDYEGFFKLYEREAEKTEEEASKIRINIPYLVEAKSDINNYGEITVNGHCNLFKAGRIFAGMKMVDITLEQFTKTISLESGEN